MAMKSVSLSKDGKELTVVIDMETIPWNTEKSLMFGTTHGYQATCIPVTVKNKDGRDLRFPLQVSVNAKVPDPDYVKPPKALN